MMFKLTLTLCLAALLVAGCGDQRQAGAGQEAREAVEATEPKPERQPAEKADAGGGFGGVMIDMADDGLTKIVIEAEDGEIEEPMGVYGDSNPPEGVDGPRGASGGKYVETPELNETCPDTGEAIEQIGGSTTVEFTVDEAGEYCFWLRVWWRHTCANSFNVGLNGMPGMVAGMGPHHVTDSTTGVWRWVAVGSSVYDPAPIRLGEGTHTLTLTSREDGSVLDQILIVNDPDYVPTGIESPE